MYTDRTLVLFTGSLSALFLVYAIERSVAEVWESAIVSFLITLLFSHTLFVHFVIIPRREKRELERLKERERQFYQRQLSHKAFHEWDNDFVIGAYVVPYPIQGDLKVGRIDSLGGNISSRRPSYVYGSMGAVHHRMFQEHREPNARFVHIRYPDGSIAIYRQTNLKVLKTEDLNNRLVSHALSADK